MSSWIYIFYLQGQLYELYLGTFNSNSGFPSGMDLSHRQVHCEFNLNAFWGELLRSARYGTSSSNVCILRIPALE